MAGELSGERSRVGDRMLLRVSAQETGIQAVEEQGCGGAGGGGTEVRQDLHVPAWCEPGQLAHGLKPDGR